MILIIGGGIAGFYVGIELLKKGFTVTILEKYPYIGGRCKTYKNPDLDIQWEIGAGRIHSSHQRLMNLIKKYKLGLFPIASNMNYFDGNIMRSNKFSTYVNLLKPLTLLSPQILANSTLKELTYMMGIEWIWKEFPYDAEVGTLRADLGLEAFLDGEMKDNEDFFVVKEGFGELIERMLAEYKRLGGKVRMSVEVTELLPGPAVKIIEDPTSHSASKISRKTDADNKGSQEKIIHADKIIFACHALGLQKIKGLRDIPSMSYVKMRPLVRIYAKFSLNSETGKSWFDGIPKTVTSTHIRYFIPINADSAMISYTDADYADPIIAEVDAGKKNLVEKKIMADLRRVFKDRDIPEPELIRIYAWSEGASYWLPGDYSPQEVSEQIMNPIPNVYICGESFSLRQAWVEGALENADGMLKKLIVTDKK
jgi:hypothetical protein